MLHDVQFVIVREQVRQVASQAVHIPFDGANVPPEGQDARHEPL